MKVLTLSDILIPFIYSPQIKRRFRGVDLAIVCGDLPYYYVEYVLNALDVPLFYVRGNHSKVVEYSSGGARSSPRGGVDLHKKVVYHRDLLLAGIEGSGRYREGPFQYSQEEMWWNIISLMPDLFFNRARYGRFLDIFVTHAPPWGIHDQPDLPHQGIRAFRWFIQAFKPAYHLHGHIHIYRPDTVIETLFGKTRVINTFGYREIFIEQGNNSRGAKS